MLSFPSAIAKPTAVEVKLLLSEKSECGEEALYGDHHPSATTFPCRSSMKLFIESILSAASMNESTAEDEMPCDSSVLRGRSTARQRALFSRTTAMHGMVFMLVLFIEVATEGMR